MQSRQATTTSPELQETRERADRRAWQASTSVVLGIQ
jgi:hypothetical protein